jgi:hypothetical protein
MTNPVPTPAEALRRLLDASIPPDSLIGADPDSKVGVGGESLRRWWWEVCVPARQSAIAALASQPAADLDVERLAAIFEAGAVSFYWKERPLPDGSIEATLDGERLARDIAAAYRDAKGTP